MTSTARNLLIDRARMMLARLGETVPASVTAAGQSLEVPGVFIDPSQVVDFGTHAEIRGTQPMFHAVHDDIAAVTQGDTVSVAGRHFEVADEPIVDRFHVIKSLTLAEISA